MASRAAACPIAQCCARSLAVSKETYYRGKRDLVYTQKRPTGTPVLGVFLVCASSLDLLLRPQRLRGLHV
jgi:hypothetical protein